MTKVRYVDSAYHITGKNVVADSELEFKFDTGAVSTFVTLGSMLGDNNVEKWGKSVLKAYAENVHFGNISLPIFYYWLSPMIDNRKLLLGDDFIRFCDFRHVHESDILIDDFQIDAYLVFHQSMNKQDCVSQSEIMEIFQLGIPYLNQDITEVE